MPRTDPQALSQTPAAVERRRYRQQARERAERGEPTGRGGVRRGGEHQLLNETDWLHADTLLRLGGCPDVETTDHKIHRKLRADLLDLVERGLVDRRLDPDGRGWSYRRVKGARW